MLQGLCWKLDSIPENAWKGAILLFFYSSFTHNTYILLKNSSHYRNDVMKFIKKDNKNKNNTTTIISVQVDDIQAAT